MKLLPPFLVLAMTLTVLAGCISDGGDEDSDPVAPVQAPVAALRCFEVPLMVMGDVDLPAGTSQGATVSVPMPNGTRQACNQEMTPDEGRAGNEVTIAVNPTDPNNIVGGAKDYYPDDAGECVWDGVYVTHDGGATYEDRSFDGSPWRLRNGDTDDFRPNYASQFWCTTDPVAYFDVNGNLYYLLMAYQADPVTGSKTGEEEIPEHPLGEGALNDWAFNRATQIIAVSDDGGDTFHTFTPVLEGSYPVNFHDKGWIAASHDGTIHVMWLAFFVPGNQYCRSSDGGQTYVCSEIVAAQFLEAGQGSFLEVGTGGQVYAVWTTGGAIQLKKSEDYGATWGEITPVHEVNMQSMPGLSSRDRRTGYPMIATDRNAESPYADAVYAVWNDACQDANWSASCAEGNNSIYFSASFDEGRTWSTGIRINDDRDADGDLSPENWQIFPAVSVSPGGVIDVSWMDTRDARWVEMDGETHLTFQQYYTYSLDGGKTWSENFPVRDAVDGGWDPALSYHQNGMIFIGDYNDIDSSWGAAHPVWPDTRYGVADVFTAVIQRPLFADGWSDEDRARLLGELVDEGLVWADHPFLGEE